MKTILQPKVRVVSTENNNGLQITVEGSSVEDVIGLDAKKLVIKTAESSGYFGAGINNQSGAFVVDSNGKAITGYEDTSDKYNAASELMATKPFTYRNIFTLRSSRP